MEKITFLAFIVYFASLSLSFTAQAQIKSWEGIFQTPLATAQKNFATPPAEFASHVIWGWDGNVDLKVIRADLDTFYNRGFRAIIIEAGNNMPSEYLSDDWFKRVATAVQEAKKRGMKVWIIDEGKFPSGFAGGKFSRERPDLRMQALVVCDTLYIAAETSLNNHAVESYVISAVAINDAGQPNRTVEITDHQINFNAGEHDWQILLVRSDFRSPSVASVNRSGMSRERYSLSDYLNPVAIRQFIDWTHEQYKKYLGKELGTTVLGFRGDESAITQTSIYAPWTPAIADIFKQKKGYDPAPYLASLVARPSPHYYFLKTPPDPFPAPMYVPLRTEQEKRFMADYWDVWSELFAVNFFKQEADWCAANGVAFITHLDNEHNMPVLARTGGSLFRNLSKIQIPGVDAIWNQIWPGRVNDFPKLASSVAHVYGKPRSFSETFAAYDSVPTIPQAKYIVDYQIVRGINYFEFMFWPAGSTRPNWMKAPGMNALNAHTNRATYLMAQGVPGARIAMYYPTSTLWMGNYTGFPHILSITASLLQHQYDFDYVNDDAFIEGTLSVGQGYLKNSSGQKYHTLIIPSADVISESAWEKIEEFAQRGGKVLFWGKKPDMLVGKSFMNPIPFPVDFVQCLAEPSGLWTQTVEAAMPAPEMRIQQPPRPRRPQVNGELPPATPTDFIRYTRRILPDADVYFLFNEGEQACTFTAEFDKAGEVKAWNSVTGDITDVPFKVANNKVTVNFEMAAWESRIITIHNRE
ncbi:MAG: hypothetical protein LBS09_03955 [Bacteroidales bacterium]|nr:hypothetical protein [Bacteroidales bacterium]